MDILVLNSGSSSLKFAVYGPADEPALAGSAEGISRPNGTLNITNILTQDHILETQEDALKKLSTHIPQALSAVAHRVVHGGPHLREHTIITPAILDQLRAAIHFAPLHIPQAIALIEQAQKIFPNVPHIACFDNAFHRTLPEVAAHLPLPTKYFEQGVQRYGFHGLSCESVVVRLAAKLPARTIIAHLGNGSSLTALRDGRSIDTSMGLTPTGGLPMGTRSGDLDPGVLLYLMRTESLDAGALETLLNHQGGLAAFSNGESDMQALLARTDAPAQLAVQAFTTAIRKTIGAYAALLGGLDLLVFTGGIGQHSSTIRDGACTGLDFLGLTPEKILVLPTQEELQMARHARLLLKP